MAASENPPVGVRRIVRNVFIQEPAAIAAFYAALFDLEILMDHGWIVTIGSSASAAPQLSFASEGGSGTLVPDLSIEVDDVDAVHERAVRAAVPIVYPLTDEPWGVRRFYLRDPAGQVVNVVQHTI